MKKKVYFFLVFSMLGLAVVPAINVLLLYEQYDKRPAIFWWNRKVLYNFDFILPYFSKSIYTLNISFSPQDTIIGKQGWLFLGDKYQKDTAINRRGLTAEELAVIKAIGIGTAAWETWLTRHGVRTVKIMLSPNKDSIYPEFLPDWAQPSTTSVTETLLANVDADLYVNTTEALRSAKAAYPQALYFKTDTHWNSFGAWIAFRAFTQEIKRSQPELTLIDDAQIVVSSPMKIDGGDLARFLRMKTLLADTAVSAQFNGIPILTEQYHFNDNKLKATGIGNPVVTPPVRPLLVKSPNALNKKKVLWLRDSFGTAVSPFMATMFSDTLQLHYDRADPALFVRMVEEFKPEYVFITVVERNARDSWFTHLPPKL